ncbi:MAG: ABC transporter permease [Clostridia bacterium]|nr:ABC transporter permease [Clostridia bacterium]
MSKFFKLCSCEFTKIMKKKSTKVMFFVLVLALLASAGITALTKKVTDYSDEEIDKLDYKSKLQAEIDSSKHELSDNTNNLDESTKNELLARIDIYQFAIDNEINMYQTYWKSNVLFSDVFTCQEGVYKCKSLGQENEEKNLQEKVDKMCDYIKNDNFNGYINYQKENLKKSFDAGEIAQENYDVQLYILNLKEKYEIGKSFNKDEVWKNGILEEIDSLKVSLATGIDQTSFKSLTEKTYKKTENRIKIDEYRLEHNMAPSITGDKITSLGSTRKVFDYISGSFIQFVLTIMMVIIAGTSISSEISKGTIKFWSCTPCKRWKILLSKLVVSTLILVICTVIISLFSTIIGNIFFGAKNAQGYLFVSNGNVHEINYVLFSIVYNLVGAIEIFVFMVFALMLSTVARNSAVSVGLSIAAYLGGSTIMQVVNMFVKSDWIKFIPFNNLSLTDRIFTGDISYSTSTMISGITGNIPIGFSFAVLGICVFLMIVTMFDSFRKRDIA